MQTLLILGILFGIIIYIFSFTLSKKRGNFHLVPLSLLFTGIGVIVYSIVGIGGFEGMGVGIIGLGILLIALISTIFLRVLRRKVTHPRKYTKFDILVLFLMPVLCVALISWINMSNEEYWVLEKSRVGEDILIQSYVERTQETPELRGYKRFTVLEGRKMLVVSLGEKGKEIEVHDVKIGRNKTEVVLQISEGNSNENNAYLLLGLDEINDPLSVTTTEGAVLKELE